jgi:Tol biopolymer transport system component
MVHCNFRRKACNVLTRAGLSCLFTLIAGPSTMLQPVGAGPGSDLLMELHESQRHGLALLLVERGVIWRLDFASGQLKKLRELPKGIEPWTRYSINWAQKKLAGNARNAIFVADLTTEEVRWFGGVGCYEMSWNHTGDMLAFVTSREGGQAGVGLYVLDVNRGKSRMIALNVSSEAIPQWSGDDSQCAFHTVQDQIAIVGVKSGKQEIITKGTFPSWSPDGKALAYQRNGEVWKVSIDGRKEVKLLGKSILKEVLNEPLRYSPDGRYGVYLRGWSDLNLVEYADVLVVRNCDNAEVRVFTRTFGQQLPVTWAVIEE